jgi:hypothetical protein
MECKTSAIFRLEGILKDEMKNKKRQKKGSEMEPFIVYACPGGPKFSGRGGCSVSLISP